MGTAFPLKRGCFENYRHVDLFLVKSKKNIRTTSDWLYYTIVYRSRSMIWIVADRLPKPYLKHM
jgi:hypothetical protein